MIYKVKDLRNKLERLKGKRDSINEQIQQYNDVITEKEKDLRNHEKAREVVRQVGLKTQQQLQYNISNITSMALDAVMEQPYKLNVEFIQRRNKTECDLHFVRNDVKINPMDGGGGAIDIAAFALRVASWSMEIPKSRSVLILDEPFKHLKGEEANKRMLEMVREISHKLGIQIIMVSDERASKADTIESTDKLFEIKMDNEGVSHIKTEE